ncbi:response regulator transcription factor [Streptomyces sp. M41]|uniref:response regulator transcription factor n=1 Tax=Streptomyces sp. M41 TaxID=3059412 RepID=UPI00374CFEE2
MGILSARDYEQMLDLTAALLNRSDSAPPWPYLVEGLIRSLHGTMSVMAVLHWEKGTGQMHAGAPDSLGQERMDSLICTHMRAHPLMRLYAARGDRSPLTLDGVADESWRRSDAYQAGREAIGVTRQLALPLPAPAGVIRTFVIGRDGPDFSDRDLAFARRLQPLLVAVDCHVRELGALRAALPAASSGPDRDPERRAAECGITPRELTVLGLLAEGLTAAATARRLNISVHTVTKHRENLYRKLGCNDRITTVLMAQELGLVPLGSPRAHPSSPRPRRSVWTSP